MESLSFLVLAYLTIYQGYAIVNEHSYNLLLRNVNQFVMV